MKLPRVLYHGTSDGYLGAILRDGLMPNSAGNGYLCYTDEEDVAVNHAQCMAEWDEAKLGRPCRAIIFAVPIAVFEVEGFVLEEKFIEIGPSGGRACNASMTAHIQERHPIDPWKWDELLTYAGAVGYARILRVEASMIMEVPGEVPAP
jgi:hypothetical protein